MKTLRLALAIIFGFWLAPPAHAQSLSNPPGSGGGGSGTVTSVSNSDSTLTLSPNPIIGTGTVSLNLAHANTWSALQGFNSSDLGLNGATSGQTLLNASATASGTATLPANTGTLSETNFAETLTGVKTFAPSATAAPASLTEQFNQSVITGTSNTAGANTIFAASQGTGTGQGGNFQWQLALAGSSGSTPNALVTEVTLTPVASSFTGTPCSPFNGELDFNGGLTIATCGSQIMPWGQTGTSTIGGALNPSGIAVNQVQICQGNQLCNNRNLLISSTAPTITAAGCGGAAASISTNNGTAAFDINVGTTPTSGGCTVTMPTAPTRWNCHVNDFTTISTSVFVQKETSSTTTSAVFQNFSDVAVATAPTASDIYHVECGGE